MDPTKIVVSVELLTPKIVKELHVMLGHTSYYEKFIKNYANITVPLEKLLKKDTKYVWT